MLLPFVVWAGPAAAQTISNVAEARWSVGPTQYATTSNRVDVRVDPVSSQITTYRSSASGGTDLVYRLPQCTSSSSGPVNTTASANGNVVTRSVDPTSQVRAGEDLIFAVAAPAANVDPGVVDRLRAVFVTPSGDREEIVIFETGPDTGLFDGQIATRRIPPTPVPGDCILGLTHDETVAISVLPQAGTAIVATATIRVLADPFGNVFDSETGEPVDGAIVTLVDAATGSPARVFAEDGVTPWPSTVVTGRPITDGAGNVYSMAPGDYWFPLTALGTYVLRVEPPQPYTAPSVASRDELALLRRPDGLPFAILDASFGGGLTLVDPTPVRVDIPLDRPGISVTITKTVSRNSAQPGDALFYSVTVRNPDAGRVKRNVVVTDTPSRWLRIREDSIRIDGNEAGDAVDIADDGSTLAFRLGDLAGGATRRVTYAMVVRADAPAGDAVNRAEAIDSLGRGATANASVRIERETIAGRMTIIGRVTAGACDVDDPRVGIPGVRVMLEDGSFAVTDLEGRYHFEGVVPGTHVVQAARMTLPEGGQFVDCHRSTRNAGSANSRFAIGQGGSLVVADFHAVIPEAALRQIEALGMVEDQPVREGSPLQGEDARPAEGANAAIAERGAGDAQLESPAESDWLALGDGPDGWLTPTVSENPRVPAIRVAIRHRKGQTIRLRVNGEDVSPLAFDGTRAPADGRYAVSTWRAVPLRSERTTLSADIVNSFGEVNETIVRDVFFTTAPARVELVPGESRLIADGRTRPILAIRVLDRNNRPLREGISGEFTLNAPYESAAQLAQQQLDQLTGLSGRAARWVVEGNEGLARIELAPTMVSGSLRLDFRFDDGEIARSQELEAWIEPGDIEWTVVGLAEGSVGARTVADNMERAGRFDSDLGDKARVALYAKGRILGKYLLTLAYDSAKQRDDQRVLGALDPEAYYTVFADGSSRRFDAASREKLYVRIETSTFYALYGDFETGFDQTRLARYDRVATGVKAEGRLGAFHAQAFAAEVGTRFRRDEIQGQGITGPYRLSSRAIVANSEKVSIETRDRFRSELIVSTRELTRFIDYELDLLSGTITFKEPVLSRDFNLNPQFLVINYEIDELGGGELNAGLRADWTSESGAIRIGATAITDKGDEARTDMGGLDLRARIGQASEIRAELGLSRREGELASAWLVEAQHQDGSLDLLAYAHQTDADYGVGQQNGAELGRRKIGADARLMLDEHVSILGSLWQDDSLADTTRRRAAQLQLGYTIESTDLRLGLSHFDDRLADNTRNRSTVLEAGATQRLMDNRLELSAASSVALDDAASIDLPARHRLGARYAITNAVRLVGTYEIAEGENIETRNLSGGFEVRPWDGGQILTTLGKQDIQELGSRSYAAFGLAQNLQVTPELAIDATLDGNRTIGGTAPLGDLLNPAHPVASGGHLGQDGTLFEDFTAATLGAAWRKDRWSATARAEYRDGEFADRAGFTLGAIRQLGEGSTVGSGLTWTRAESEGGATAEIMDAALAFAHRPDASDFAMLGKLEFRSDKVTNAVEGSDGPVGRTALNVTGDAISRRLLASVSTNWSPRGEDREEDGSVHQMRRDELGLFVGLRYNFDEIENYDLGAVTGLVGADARIGLGERFEIGGTVTVRANFDDNLTSFSYGPHVGFVPADGMLLTIGYNVSGFRDPDFSAARNTDKGLYAAIRAKFDADTFSFLGLGR